jgi:DNA-binding NarL/FixJ family response regulator
LCLIVIVRCVITTKTTTTATATTTLYVGILQYVLKHAQSEHLIEVTALMIIIIYYINEKNINQNDVI